MKLTKKGHACVRLEKDGAGARHRPGRLQRAGRGGRRGRDPGHPRARRPLRRGPAAGRAWRPTRRAEIWTPGQRRRTSSPRPSPAGCTPSATVTPSPRPASTSQVHGELHAVIHPDIPRITNVGYLVDGSRLPPRRRPHRARAARSRRCCCRCTRRGTRSPRSSTTCARSSRRSAVRRPRRAAHATWPGRLRPQIGGLGGAEHRRRRAPADRAGARASDRSDGGRCRCPAG